METSVFIDAHHQASVIAPFLTGLTAAIAAALIICLFLAVVLVNVLLDLYAEEPDVPESSRQAHESNVGGGSSSDPGSPLPTGLPRKR